MLFDNALPLQHSRTYVRYRIIQDGATGRSPIVLLVVSGCNIVSPSMIIIASGLSSCFEHESYFDLLLALSAHALLPLCFKTSLKDGVQRI